MKQILLKGVGYSGRGVRLVTLSMPQLDAIREEAAKAIPNDEGTTPAARNQVYVNEQKRNGVPAMIAEVTEKAGFAKRDELLQAAWKKPTVDELRDSPEKYFTTKDLDALGDLFFKLHLAQPKEVEDILGEALDVTSD